jgi:hypothetical protein
LGREIDLLFLPVSPLHDHNDDDDDDDDDDLVDDD